MDLFKALALGADAALICRPFVPAVYGGGAEGVQALVDKLGGELDILVNAHGVQRRHSAEVFPQEDWDLVINVNLNSVFILDHKI